MSKRDYISEIISKKERLKKRSPRWNQLSKRLVMLISLKQFANQYTRRNKSIHKELPKYFPIGFVACIEGYFRLAIMDLINHGKPFSDNAKKFKDYKFTVEHIIALQEKKVSYGELISHLLPLNGLDEIESTMSLIMGKSFLKELINTKTGNDEIFSGKSLEEVGKSNKLISDINKLYELRHIFAHELAPSIIINTPEISSCSQAATVFMFLSETLISNILTAP